MRILVLGGTVFLSAEIARQAVAAGHHVTCLARGTSADPPDGVTWLRGDRSLGAAAFADVTGGWDEVVDVTRDPVQAGVALEVLGPAAAHWTFVSSCSVYADHSVPGADESAALLEPLPEGQAGTPDTYGESKSAIERMTRDAVGEKAHIVRSGLIGGPGDGTDRYGYWPARFAANSDPVLVPDVPDASTQIIDVGDLAAWILQSAEQGLTGTYNALGEVVRFEDYLQESQRAAGASADVTVRAPEEWLVQHGVGYWSGQDSLPLWLPAGHEGFQARSNRAATARGMTLRPWQETLAATLEDEKQRGLDRDRKAGLRSETEQGLVALRRREQR
ncbi:NAD-dependent epimerase/dehydratase family protein [Paenarthrobacter aurescens]|uniref:Reductase n=1 Tax=Paenarthrobacter aurescens TaxID=43663 RepID=A0A4Y3NN42_PAEAU|nr:NAD-dependent epimerase/dehydratase family protein [Paenarthrobacter aurescens]MDO6143821.1 epimerase [Paenarthrobacter aurescens]MDO6147668.1 epimerase [Paenarthrobacter aurescens]MDO6158912.1 epimerase [Paenarthrobacter aurescens]MDO6162896.1 epimerase [Paenarthrobacter aurescens]GEB20371.1 reductase [Paenarthrobacter aurescens]